MGIHGLHNCFYPTSVAAIGVSGRPSVPGKRLVANLAAGGYTGRLSIVNVEGVETRDLPVYPDLKSVKTPIDLALIVAPIDEVPGLLGECGKNEVKAAVVISRGGLGQASGQALRRQAFAAGIRLIGPRSWGLVNPWIGLHAGLTGRPPEPGGLAVISQSAAICANIVDLARAKHIGLAMVVGVGDMAEVDCADVLDYMAGQSRVKAVLLHLEQLEDLRKFMSAARAAACSKPIMVLKTGRGTKVSNGNEPPDSDLIEEDDAYDAAFRRAGLVRVKTVEDLFSCGDLAGKQVKPDGPRLVVLTNTRSPGVMAADRLRDLGIDPAHLSEETKAAIEAVLGKEFGERNPVNLPVDAPPEVWRRVLEICRVDDEIDGVLAISTPQFMTDPLASARAIAAAGAIHKPLFAVWMGGTEDEAGRRVLQEAGVPTYDTPETAVQAYAYLLSFTENLNLLQETPPESSRASSAGRGEARRIVAAALAEKREGLEPLEAMQLLAAYGIPTADARNEATGPPDLSLNLGSRLVGPFGPVVFFGPSGVERELSLDRAVGLPPLNRLLARMLMKRTRVGRLLAAPNRFPPEASAAVEETLVRIADLAIDFPELAEIEIEPLLVVGSAVYARKASVRVRPTAVRTPMHLIIRPYPGELEAVAPIKSGREVFIRPLKPEDADRYRDFWGRLSQRSIFYRFNKYFKELTRELVIRFTQLDYDREIALAALDRSGEDEVMLAVARLVWAPGSDEAECAVVVGDPWQGRGVGAELLRRLIAIARKRGIKTIWGLVLRENRGMIDLAKKLGFKLIPAEDAFQMEIRLDLPAGLDLDSQPSDQDADLPGPSEYLK